MAKDLYKNIEWTEVAKDYNSPFLRNYVWTAAAAKIAAEFDIPMPIWGIASTGSTIAYVISMQTWEAAHGELRRRVIQDPKYLDKLLDDTLVYGELFVKWSQDELFARDLTTASNKELASLFEEFTEKQSMMYAYGVQIPILDFQEFSFVEGSLKKFLRAKTSSDEDYEKLYSTFTAPMHNSFAQDQEEDLLRLMQKHYDREWSENVMALSLSEIKDLYPEFHQDLSEHTSKHGWVYYVYAGPSFSEEQFLGFIRSYIEKSVHPSEHLERLAKRREDIDEKKRRHIEELDPDDFNGIILQLASKVVWAKPRRKDYQSRAYFHAEKLLREIGRRLFLSLNQVRSMPFDMIESALAEGNVDQEQIRKIEEMHVCIGLPPKGDVTVLTGGEAKIFIDNLIKIEHEGHADGVLKGSTAYPGSATGIVRVINVPSDIAKMQPGDILVSTATTPSIVPAMRMAAAIVTDEGGLTCHAAIVSRELSIPCVVGTKTATVYLKDGDIVEVNAKSGIVSKL